MHLKRLTSREVVLSQSSVLLAGRDGAFFFNAYLNISRNLFNQRQKPVMLTNGSPLLFGTNPCDKSSIVIHNRERANI